MKVLTKLTIQEKLKNKSPKFQVIILDIKGMKNSYNGRLLGRTLSDWVAFACNGHIIKKLEFDLKQNILEFVKNELDSNFDYTIILLSTTPLIEQSTIKDIIEYSTIKGVGICKLPVGYVVNNQSLLNDNTQIDSLYSQNIENFYIVENKKQYNYASDILQERINNFHIDNGVDIIKPKSVYIEPEVDIEGGVIIYPNNSLKGTTTIYKDVILKENNVIENSKIGEHSCVSGSVIVKSVISSNVYISSFCEVINSLIAKDCIIDNSVTIRNYSVPENSKLKSNSVLGDTNDSNSGTGKSR